MREHKYRIYNIDRQQWMYFSLAGKTGNISLQLLQLDDNTWIQPDDPMQEKLTALGEWTGLNDKNGVEIYESDILNGEYIVEWLGKGFTAKSKGKLSMILTTKGFKNSTVTGNIYEN